MINLLNSLTLCKVNVLPNPLTPSEICNSPYYQPYNSYNFSLEKLALDQLIIPKLIFFYILVTYLLDVVLIL